MIKDVKILKLREINNEIQKYMPINEQKAQNAEQMNKVEEEIKQNTGLILYRNFSWFQKHVTQRKQYKNYITNKEICEKNIEDLQMKKEELLEESNKIDAQLERQYELKNEYEKIKDAKTLEELGMDFKDSIEFLKENNMPIVLTKDDQYINKEKDERKDYKGIEDLMLVHKTKYPPEQSKIKSSKEAESIYDVEIELNDKTYASKYAQERNTVHFAVNHEVMSHEAGEWDDAKYAVLIPFEDVPKSQIGCAEPVDTFVVGGVKLTPNSWILCPKGEREKIQKNNPEVQIMEYEGKNVKEYPDVLLHELGYQIENGGKWKWRDVKAQEQFGKIMEKENIERGHHSFTQYSKKEEMMENANLASAIFGIIKDNKLANNDKEMRNIYEQVNKPWNIKIASGDTQSEKYSFNEIIKDALGENNEGKAYLYEKLKGQGIDMRKYDGLINRISEEEKERLPEVLQKCVLVETKESMVNEKENDDRGEER